MTSTHLRPGAVTERQPFARLLGAGVWLGFLSNPLGRLLRGEEGPEQVLGVVGLAAFAGIYLLVLTRVREIVAAGHGWRWLAGLLACWAATIPGAGDQSMTCLVFVAALGVAVLPGRWAIALVAACSIGITVAAQVVDGWLTHGNNLAVLLAAAAAWAFRLAWQRQAELVRAERELAGRALNDERSRIARDLHDILGHSLTVITVKAELAERLISLDPERARTELVEVQRLGRDALADVRATAQGIRSVSLPGEIAAARSALESAGIEANLPTTADEVPSRWRELFAWTLREAVTNVIRHSGASRCTVTVTTERLTIHDDGCGAVDGPRPSSSGLDGLRRRAEALGAAVTTQSVPGHGFELSLRVPA